MKSNRLSVRSQRLSLWLASLAAAGLLPLGAAGLHAQTVYIWNGGAGSWSNGLLWSTGSLPNSASADVYIDGGKTGTASVVSIDNNYAMGRLTVDAGDTLNVVTNTEWTVSNGAFAGSGSIVNNGTINFNDAGNGTFLRFAGAGSITGTGTINLNGLSSRIFVNNYGDRITVGAGQTVAGRGFVGNGQSNLTNNGTLTANQNGNTLVLSPTSNGTGDFTNAGAGVARAENGGVLELAGGATFTGNSFTALAGSRVQVDGGAIVSNATLASVGAGTVTMDSARLTNATLAGSVSINNNAEPVANGTLTNNGTLTVNDTGSGTFLRLGGPTTLAGTGTVVLSGGGARLFANNAGDRLTISAGQTVAGMGFLGNGSTVFTNNGTVTANVNGSTLVVQPGGGTADFTNAGGLLQAQNGGTLAFSGGTLTNNGQLQVLAGSTLTVVAGALTNFSGTTLTGGQYVASGASASAPATLSFGGGSVVTNNAFVSLSGPGSVFNEINALATNASSGTFNLGGGRNFTTAGALTNAGAVLVAASTLTVSGVLNNSGLTSTSGGGAVAVQGNVTNSGTIRTQSGTFSVQGTLASSGVLLTSQASEAGAISSTGALTQTAGGTLAGFGSVTAPTLSLAGSLRPGDNRFSAAGPFSSAVGTLTLNGAVGLLGNTAFIFDLAGTAASDRITVNGALTLDGTLTVNALSGFGAGRYDLIDYSGALTNNVLELGALPSGYTYAIDTSISGQVDLVVTSAVPEPSTWVGGLLGTAILVFRASRRRKSQV